MFIVHVTPIAKGGLDQLSYFSSQEIPVGAVVRVPLRNKEVPALVLEREDARTIKAILRTSIYETKKIATQDYLCIFSPEFVRAAQKTATYFATSIGSIMYSYVPAAILDAGKKGEVTSPRFDRKAAEKFEKLVLQLPKRERLGKYKTIIRSNFAQGKSVFLCTSTVLEAHSLKEQYGRGIEQYTYVLESTQSKRVQVETWNNILNEEHPVLIIATPTFASIPRRDIAMFIIEREMSSSYKQQERPHADARILLDYIARETDSALVYAGTTVSLRVHKELRNGFATELEEHPRKLRSTNTLRIVDGKEARQGAKNAKRTFPSLSPKTMEVLTRCMEGGRNSFIFSARRGIASHTVCNDCASIIECHQCKSPMTLHEHRGSRNLLCHRCGTTRDAHETCTRCGSWNLVPLGIGIERVGQFIHSELPDCKTFVLSSDTAKTTRQAQKIVDAFYTTKGSVLIGTEMALPYLAGNICCAAMSSIDSLLCVPDFQIEEKIFGIIAAIREHVEEELIIETSTPENLMLRHAKSGSISEYVDEELQLRRKLHYPPYTTLVKITSQGPRHAVIEDMSKFVNLIEKYKPRVFGGFIRGKRGEYLHALVRISSEKWPDEALVHILNTLPKSFEINVNPERML
ncbi:hypothetical protein CL652_01810 [bacterium]|nr:hypothetical protein [bacterium]|tara:strand:+ start:14605 stop:16500 length:1896 start_codon:yes stop_codon:yes gene_type:complete